MREGMQDVFPYSNVHNVSLFDGHARGVPLQRVAVCRSGRKSLGVDWWKTLLLGLHDELHS